MTGNKRAIASDFQKRLERIDAHVIQPEEYEDAPELTDAQLAQADLYEGEKLIRRGRPPSDHRKVPVKVRLDPDVVDALRASGRGWQTRINDTLRATFLTVKGGKIVRRKVSVPAHGVMIIRGAKKPAGRSAKGITIKTHVTKGAKRRHPNAKRA